MIKKLYRFIWSAHSCFSEVRLFCSSNYFIKNIRFFYQALAQEEKALNLKAQCNHLNTMILVGAGPIPYTALYYRKSFSQIICIEKNRVLAAMSGYLIRKKGIKNIAIVPEGAINYKFPNKALIYISLLTQGKEAVFRKVCQSSESLICLRMPNLKSLHRYEQGEFAKTSFNVVNIPQLAMKSILIDTNTLKQASG